MLVYEGQGVLNTIINKLPFELHFPGYRYCGPGTKLQKRLARGDPGINPLDTACKAHDIAYSENHSLDERHKADWELENKAWERVKSKDATFGEKSAAWLVTTGMKAKRKMGAGLGDQAVAWMLKVAKRKLGLGAITGKVGKSLKKNPSSDLKKSAAHALKVARMLIKKSGGRKSVRIPRIIPIPKSGGFLPLIPLFAGLSALGALSGGAAGIAKTVIDAKNAQKKLEEDQRHNRAMESIGKGLYLRKNAKGGLGLFLKKQKNYR